MFGQMIGGGGYQSNRDGMMSQDPMASLGGAINPAQKPMMPMGPQTQPQMQPRPFGSMLGAMQGGQGMGNPMGGAPFGLGQMGGMGQMGQAGQGGQNPMLQMLLSKMMGGGIR